ncbi:MAG: glycoside hydrolase family 88 protein [candidate division NC10 bacterium]|nr:glycoside hydrolase family 88 protein [candidate division NC10 bacterium]
MGKIRTPDEALALALERVESTLFQVTREDVFPHAAPSTTGVWEGTREGMWTSGFWAGLLWQRAALTGRAEDSATAKTWSLRLAPHVDHHTHDLGFIFSSSAVLGWEIGRVPECRDLALRAADRLAGMVNPAVGVIPLGSQAEIAAGLDDVTIDCMVNLPLLWWAWRTTGEERFMAIGVSHSDRTAGWHVKEDGRIIQSTHFDPRTGRVTKQETHQGSGTEGCWARGQAWGVYGFAAAYRATGEERFLEVADRAAAYYFHRAGGDLVPFYCFDDPAKPNVPRDSSAAAITCAGLMILAEHAPDPIRRRSRDRAEALLSALVIGYLTPLGDDDRRPTGMLLHGCYNKNAGWHTDHELVWGDYYLLEALRAWVRLR